MSDYKGASSSTTTAKVSASDDERQRKASHISLNEDQSRMTWVQGVDKDKDGKINFSEIAQLANLNQHAQRTNRALKRGFVVLAFLVLVLSVVTIGLTFTAVQLATKDSPKASTSGAVTSNDGSTLATVGVATNKVPLYVLPVLAKDDLEQMSMISLTLKNLEINNESTFYQSGEGSQTTEFGFYVASYARINTTFAVFHDYAGNQLAVRNGAVHFRFAPGYFFKGEYRVCSSNVTCANTELEGVDVAALRSYATEELVKISSTIDIDNFRRSRRQMLVVEFSVLTQELQTDGCLTTESRSTVVDCLAVENDHDICYIDTPCTTTVHTIMSACGRPTSFDGVPTCGGTTEHLLEVLFGCDQ